jgi:AcrR family transcriptional regulator
MRDETGQRRYRKQKRALQEEETRRRITEAVVELHRTVGPANTKVTEVAERAGVSRMTVYNHFPTEGDLIAACSAHWTAENPFPDPASWSAIPDFEERLTTALGELYAWYSGTADMMGNVLRDAPIVEPLDQILDTSWRPYVAEVVERIGEALPGSERADVHAAVRVVVDFHTWRLLADATDARERAVRLATRMVGGAVSVGRRTGW